MQIQQKSFCSFLLKFKSGEVLVNPTSKIKEEITVYSLDKSPYLKYPENDNALCVNSAGEYESKDIFFSGEKVKEKEVVLYKVSGDDVTVGIVGFVNETTDVDVDFFESADILLLGSGGGMNLTPKDAHNLIQKIGSKICICFGFSEQGNNDLKQTLLELNEFLKEIPGATAIEEKSLKIQKEELDRIEDTVIYYFK